MPSSDLWLTCKNCSKKIPAKAIKCPHCSAVQPRGKRRKWLFIGLGVFVGLSFVNAMVSSPKDNGVEKTKASAPSQIVDDSANVKIEEVELLTPKQQTDFVSIAKNFRTDFDTANNEIKQSIARDGRAKAIRELITSTAVESWYGTIVSIETTSEGKAIFMVRLADNVHIGTWNNALSDYLDGTLIEKTDPVYSALADMKAGDKVIFSGNFIPSQEDGVKERSITIRGSMQDPEFLFKFNQVAKP